MENVGGENKGQRETVCYHFFYQLAYLITRCPFFSLWFQWAYLIIAILLPLFWDDWTYSRFLLFFLFTALSIIPQSIRLWTKKRKIDYSGFVPKWYGAYLQKNADHPEVKRSMTGAFVCVLFLGSLSSLVIMQLSIILCVPLLILMEWYLWHKK